MRYLYLVILWSVPLLSQAVPTPVGVGSNLCVQFSAAYTENGQLTVLPTNYSLACQPTSHGLFYLPEGVTQFTMVVTAPNEYHDGRSTPFYDYSTWLGLNCTFIPGALSHFLYIDLKVYPTGGGFMCEAIPVNTPLVISIGGLNCIKLENACPHPPTYNMPTCPAKCCVSPRCGGGGGPGDCPSCT